MYNAKVNTNFHDDKIPEENERHECLSVILVDSVVKVDKKFYPQILLEECKYAMKKKYIMNTTDEELNLDEFVSESDESDESNKED